MSKQICTSCGMPFSILPKEGRHHPKDCPEGLDQECPACDPDVYATECKSCRPKQDMQR